MRGAVLYGPRDVRFEERETPKIVKPTDAIIRISGHVCLRVGPVAVSRHPADCPADPDGSRVLRHR